MSENCLHDANAGTKGGPVSGINAVGAAGAGIPSTAAA